MSEASSQPLIPTPVYFLSVSFSTLGVNQGLYIPTSHCSATLTSSTITYIPCSLSLTSTHLLKSFAWIKNKIWIPWSWKQHQSDPCLSPICFEARPSLVLILNCDTLLLSLMAGWQTTGFLWLPLRYHWLSLNLHYKGRPSATVLCRAYKICIT